MSFLLQQLFSLRDLVSARGRLSRQVSRKRPLLQLEMLEKRLTPTPNTWTGLGDHATWNLGSNWSSGIPVAGQDVIIPSTGVNGTASITLSVTAANIDSLTTSVPVFLEGTTLTTTGGGTPATGGVTLDNNATLTITGNGALIIATNSQTIGGDSTGAVVFGDASPANAITVSAPQLTLAAGTLIEGKIGTLNGTGTVVNNSTIKALNSGNILLGDNVLGSGTITTDGSSTVSQAGGTTLSNATISGEFVPASPSNPGFLSNDTVTSTGTVDLNVPTGAEERVTNGLNLKGVIKIRQGSFLGFGVAAGESITLSGSGSITFDGTAGNRLSLDNGVQLNVAAGITIDGQNGSIGTAVFASPTGTLINNGVIRDDVLGGTLNISGTTITNSGTLQALNGGNLSLNTLITGSGTITTDGSSTVTQNADTISGNTIAGLLSYTNSGSNQLLNDTISSSGVVTTIGGEDRVSGGFTLNGAVNINGGSYFGFGVAAAESITLKGSGSITFDSNVNNHLSLDNGVQLTVAPGITIHGQNGTIGTAEFAGPTGILINNGVIRDDVAGSTLTVSGTTITNNGTLQALNGGALILSSPVSGSGSITTDGSSTVTQSNVFISGNTIAGLLSYTNGNSNSVLLNDTISSSGVVTGPLGQDRVSGGLTLNGVINIDAGSAFGFGVAANESITLSGSGSINLGDSNTNNRVSLDNGVQLTVAAGIVIHGQNGTIGGLAFASPAGAIINNSTIQADVAGGTLNLSSATVTNNGTLQALNGGDLSLNTLVTGGTITTDGSSTVSQGGGATLSNATISGEFAPGSTGNPGFLSNDTVSSTGTVDLNLVSGAEERVTNGLNLMGVINIRQGSFLGFGVAAGESITLSGNGGINFDGTASNRITLDNGVQLTVAGGITIDGQNGFIGPAVFASPTGTLINNGVIRDDVLGGTLTLSSTTITNNGTLQALNGGDLNLTIPSSLGSGTITTDGSSTVTQSGVVISGQTIAGLVNYNGSGANLLTSDTFTVGSTLLGIGGSERVTGALALNGVIDIFGGSDFGFGVAANESFTLSGSGTFTFDGNTGNRLSLDNGAVLTLGSGFSIHGQSGIIGGVVFASPGGALINNGVIRDDVLGGGLTIGSVTTTNNGTIQAAQWRHPQHQQFDRHQQRYVPGGSAAAS